MVKHEIRRELEIEPTLHVFIFAAVLCWRAGEGAQAAELLDDMGVRVAQTTQPLVVLRFWMLDPHRWLNHPRSITATRKIDVDPDQDGIFFSDFTIDAMQTNPALPCVHHRSLPP